MSSPGAERNTSLWGGPAGGNGGRGGSIYIEATNDLTTLVEFRFKAIFEADAGERGRGKNQRRQTGQGSHLASAGRHLDPG